MLQPTVLTSALDAEAFALNYPSLWNKVSDQALSIHMPPYRRHNKGRREP
jgi:hypothetical protein